MKWLRYLLFPFTLGYYLITQIRNYFYDLGIFKSYEFEVPIIAVGNLSVGGTGKTPQIEYLIRLLQDDYSVATLSRGYKRESSGFILANKESTVTQLGDEPFQMHQKFPRIQVAVDADRKNGIENLLQLHNKPEVILMDDAMQHRRVKAGFYVLLTTFNELFVADFLLPTGNLRESREGSKRANVVVVTKCPENLTSKEKEEISTKIHCYTKNATTPIFFSTVGYSDRLYNKTNSIDLESLKNKNILLVAGIANPVSFITKIKEVSENVQVSLFADHHNFTTKEIGIIEEELKSKLGITTEKDFVRLQDKIKSTTFYYLPVKSEFLENQAEFNFLIKQFVNRGLNRV
jgi:tetraacyldisaccharide 4'-kinase